MKKICCFGELLLRMSPDVDGNWLHSNAMPVHLGGAELNVATALSKWNIPVKYISAAPDNYLSRQLTAHISKMGIETKDFIYCGNRIGTYYLPQGSDVKNAGIIYDRAYSSYAELEPGQVDWEKLLQDVSWFHFSAIDPAVSANAAAVCKEVLQVASAKNITISVDLNYRAKLWKYGKEPAEVMPELVAYCDVVMGNLWAAEKMLNIPVDADLKDEKAAYVQHAHKTSVAVTQQFPKCRQVASTFRFDPDNSITYYATLYRDNELSVSKEFGATAIVDKVGSGDCFMAALIYGNEHGFASQQTIDFAAAAAFDKLFVKGDATSSTVEDIQKRM